MSSPNYREKVNIHDRDFQKFSVDNRIYCVPVDEDEEERLVTQYDVIHSLFGGRLYFPNIVNPRKILECGYGLGQWAVAVAQEHAQCEVTAVDIYPADLPEVPDNLLCEIYNLNNSLNDPEIFEPNAFDLINSRFVAPGIHRNRWRSYVRDMKALLRPGGWLQMVEYYLNFQSYGGSLPTNSNLSAWWREYASAMDTDREPRIAHQLQGLMTAAGFREVGGSVFNLPIGPWDTDATKAAIGRANLDNVAELLDSLAIWPLTHRRGYTADRVKTLTDAARLEAGNMNLKLYIPVYVAWGRKSRRK
ncbi:S-adenosyl-L-methionine-dependent methyltransferase [Zopfia rhizophila CBS 207.26]|uniref:S-adenosyl-L-methionine-dependent methyltransferase n=1 Tax=Zopfia rhizophila CBS 207.26 TaxID=1314779 RepID=A0A6A6DLX4_9PEZI|nr:S-adenosyl-L-methionine-dependent methyltransferase [Zopfia rhizophila CBS 207.26]